MSIHFCVTLNMQTTDQNIEYEYFGISYFCIVKKIII